MGLAGVDVVVGLPLHISYDRYAMLHSRSENRAFSHDLQGESPSE